MPALKSHPAFCLRVALAALGALLFSTAACKRAGEQGREAKTAPPTSGPPTAEPETAVADRMRELAAMLGKALTAYNAGDQRALFADFATAATPPASDRIFAELFEGFYKAEFGRIVALRLSAGESVPDPDYGVLVYDAKCEKQPLVKVSANFLRENGALKIVQLRFEKVETAAK